MSRISKQLAEQIARALISKKRNAESESKKEFREYCTKVAEERVPKDVMAFFKKHSEYVKTNSTIHISGKGLARKQEVSLLKALPSISPNCYYEHIDFTDEESDKAKELFDKWQKLKDGNNILEAEIEATLISLRTYANIEKEFPEASRMLPKQGLTVIVDTASLREKLKN